MVVVTGEAGFRIAEMLLSVPVPDSSLEGIAARVPRELAAILALHPLRTSAMVNTVYTATLWARTRRLLVSAGPLPEASIDHIVARERDPYVLAELLFVTSGTLTVPQLTALATAIGVDVSGRPAAELEAACADALGTLAVWEQLRVRRRELMLREHDHQVRLLGRPEAAARSRALERRGGRGRPALPRLDVDVPLSRVSGDLDPLAGHWLHGRIGNEPAGWVVAAALAGDPTLTDLATVAAGVLTSAPGADSGAARPPQRRPSWQRRLPRTWLRRVGRAMTRR